MESQEGDVEGTVVEPLHQLLVRIQPADPVATFAEGVGDPLARAEGDLTFKRQAARDDRDRAVEGHWTPPQPAGRP
jgi:hypothetical protein